MDASSSSGHRVTPVSLRTLTGQAHPSNRGALDWSGPAGLVAYGCGSTVVAVDPATMQVAQVLDEGHGGGAVVVRVCWNRASTTRHPADR